MNDQADDESETKMQLLDGLGEVNDKHALDDDYYDKKGEKWDE